MRWHRLALLLALAGCGGGDCAPVTCASQLTLRLPAGVTQATACVEGVCTSAVVNGALLVPLGRRAEGDTAAVSVTVPGRAAAYVGEVALQRTSPQGDCRPDCVTGTAALDVQAERVVAAPS